MKNSEFYDFFNINHIIASISFTTEILVVKPVEATIVPKPFCKSSVTFISLWLIR